MRITIVLAGMLVAAAAAPVSAAQGQAQSSAGAKETKYCIEYEVRTGSHIRERACLTKEEWAKRGVNIDDLRK
jgi:hypothetical protein